MRGSRVRSRVRKFVAHAVPINLPLFDEWTYWARSKVGRSDLLSLLTISALLIWSLYTDISYDKFYQFMTTSFKLEEINNTSLKNTPSNTSKFFESLIDHLPKYLSATIIKHSTATISLVYAILFISFLVFSSPIYQLRYIRNKEFTGYSFLVYFIYCWLFISMLSHLPIIYYLVEEPLSLFPYFYALTFITVSSINITFRIILGPIFVFHIGLRKRIFEIFQSSAFISLACSMLYANCGNTFEIFELKDFNKQAVEFEMNGSVIFCQKLFETVALSGNKNYNDIPPVLILWLTGVTTMCVNYIIEGIATDRFIFFTESDLNQITQYIETEVMMDSNQYTDSDVSINASSPSTSIHSNDSNDNSSIQSVMESQSSTQLEQKIDPVTVISKRKISTDSSHSNTVKIRRIIHSAEPRNIHEMTSWFAMSTSWVLLDIVIAGGTFLDRYDRRELNNSLEVLKSIIESNKKKMQKNDENSDEKPRMSYNNSFTSMNNSNNNLQAELSNSNIIYYKPSVNISSNLKVTDLTDSEQCASCCFSYLQHKTELWFDFMADCGDGFHSSYEVARLLAQPYLKGSNGITLKRADLLLIGGDLSYPGPTNKNYQEKFFRVFEDAMHPPENIMKNIKNEICPEIAYNKPQLANNESLSTYKGPTCLLIPGNHDWYDGLQIFCKLICNRNWLAGWYLPQTKSYWVKSLAHNWWIFAADYALNNDIDFKQFEYFAKIIEIYFNNNLRNERVIIITHEPDWIVNDHENHNDGQNLQYLINNIIGNDRLRLRLAGDIHNYTRHESQLNIQSGLKYNMIKKKKNKNDDREYFSDEISNINPSLARSSTSNLKRSQSAIDVSSQNKLNRVDATLIVSGGGGAFLHPTHVPEKKPIVVNNIVYERICEYPSIIQSNAYAVWNIFGFRKRNLQFDLLGGILYYLMVSSLFPMCNLGIDSHIKELTWRNLFLKFIEIFINATFEIFERSYISITVFILGFFGMYFWTEPRLNVKFRIFIAFIHLIAHYIGSLTVIILMEMIIETAIENELIGKKLPYDIFETHFSKTHNFLLDVDNKLFYNFNSNIGIIPILKILFTVIDITSFHVSLRGIICSNKYKQIQLIFEQFKNFPMPIDIQIQIQDLPSRFTRLAYAFTSFLFYFIFAAPIVSLIVGLYLYISQRCGKFNEAFSSLRLDRNKNFVRFHLKYDGSLHCYVIGIDKVPHRWRQDPKWDGRGTLLSIPKNEQTDTNDSLCERIITSPNKKTTRKRIYSEQNTTILNARDMRHLDSSYNWKYPSRWISYNSYGDTNRSAKYEYRRVKIIDQFVLH
eukprot:449670_1